MYVVKTNALICTFVFGYAKSMFSHDAAHLCFKEHVYTFSLVL